MEPPYNAPGMVSMSSNGVSGGVVWRMVLPLHRMSPFVKTLRTPPPPFVPVRDIFTRETSPELEFFELAALISKFLRVQIKT